MKKPLLILFSCLFLSFQSKGVNVNLDTKIDDACNEGIGYIEVHANGGVSPYTFVWSGGVVTNNGATSKSSSLMAGTYTVTVYDATGDSATGSYPIANYSDLTRNGQFSYIFSAVDPFTQSAVYHPCPGQSDGMMWGHLELVGGISPYTAPGIVNIFNPVTGQINNNAFAGIVAGPLGDLIQVINLSAYDSYTIETHDAGGCLGTFYGQMYGPDNFISNSVITLPACNGLANGSAMISYTGTNPWPLDVTLYDSTTNAVAAFVSMGFPNFTVSSNLLAGTYRVNFLYSNTVSACDTNFYVTIADAGTNCGTISGKVYVDSIHNCTLDVNEPGLPSQLIKLTPGPYYATSDASGDFSFNVPYGSYIVAQVIPSYGGYMQNYFPVCNPTLATINGVTTTATRNIGDSANIVYDLSIGLTSTTARPGFNFHYGITVLNNSFIAGTSPLVTLTVDPILTFVSCNFPYTDLGGGVYTVQLATLNVFNAAQINFYFAVPPNPALIGTSITAGVSVSDVISENNTINNSDAFTQTIMGSFDPNDKTVLPSNDPNNTYFVDIDSMLTYTIRFQNTGNDTAFNIRIADTLSQWLDINSLDIKAASHTFTWNVSGNGILEFRFDNILLPDSNTNEEQSHGSVTYTIRPLSTVPLQTIIPNTAAIYFDFNPAVNTNTITSFIEITVGLNELNNQNQVSIIPNPSHNFIKILLNEKLQSESYSLKIFNLQGQEVMKVNNIIDQKIISLEQLASGCYFYHLEKEGRVIEHSQGKIILNK